MLRKPFAQATRVSASVTISVCQVDVIIHNQGLPKVKGLLIDIFGDEVEQISQGDHEKAEVKHVDLQDREEVRL